MIRFLQLLFVLALASANGFSARRPNVLLIMADDMGYSDLGCFGGEILTPRLDSLAKGGIRFSNFYSVCAGFRASMLRGLSPDIIRTMLHRLPALPEALRTNGCRPE